MSRECKQIKEFIEDYMHGELDENQTRAVSEHIESCSECQVFYLEEQKLDALLDEYREYSEATIDDATVDRIWANVQEQLQTRAGWWEWFIAQLRRPVIWAPAAGVALTAAALILMLRLSAPPLTTQITTVESVSCEQQCMLLTTEQEPEPIIWIFSDSKKETHS